jgi:hypothetical protein
MYPVDAVCQEYARRERMIRTDYNSINWNPLTPGNSVLATGWNISSRSREIFRDQEFWGFTLLFGRTEDGFGRIYCSGSIDEFENKKLKNANQALNPFHVAHSAFTSPIHVMNGVSRRQMRKSDCEESPFSSMYGLTADRCLSPMHYPFENQDVI